MQALFTTVAFLLALVSGVGLYAPMREAVGAPAFEPFLAMATLGALAIVLGRKIAGGKVATWVFPWALTASGLVFGSFGAVLSPAVFEIPLTNLRLIAAPFLFLLAARTFFDIERVKAVHRP